MTSHSLTIWKSWTCGNGAGKAYGLITQTLPDLEASALLVSTSGWNDAKSPSQIDVARSVLSLIA